MPEDLTLPHPDACADAAAPEGWTLERESFVQDDERVLDLQLSQPGAPARRIALRLVGPAADPATGPAPGSGRAEAFWAFAPASFDAAIRADLPEQDAGVEAMAACLSSLFPGGAEALIGDMRAAWAETRARLEAGLDAAEKAGFSAEAPFVVNRQRASLFLGLPISGARLDPADKHVLVELNGRGHVDANHGRWNQCYTRMAADQRPRPVTEADIAALDFLSGHEKLELMAGSAPARVAFDERRGAGPAQRRLHPLRRRGGAARHGMRRGELDPCRLEIEALSASGDHFLARFGTSGRRFVEAWKLWCRLPGQNTRMLVSGSDCAQLRRLVSGEGAFKTPAALDDAAARLIALILDVDLPVEPALLPAERDDFDPSHPVLYHPALTHPAPSDPRQESRAIPPRHQPLIGLLLGAPYAKALDAAQKEVAKAAKKAVKEAEVHGLADQLPDGAIFGRVARSRSAGDLLSQGTKLGLVRTVPGKGKRRRREIAGLVGFETSRPLTPKHIARMKRLEKPDALKLVHDLQIHSAFDLAPEDSQRDGIEGAYRLSFLLDPGAPNPIMEAGIGVEARDGAEGGPGVRLTHARGGETALLVLAALVDRDFGDAHGGLEMGATGAAIGIIVHGPHREVWLRPALRGMEVAMPEYDRASLRAALAGLAEKDGVDPRHLAPLEEQLGAPWDKLAKKWRKSWP